MSEMQVADQVEVLVPLKVEDAERLDRRIRLMAQTTRDNFEKVGRLLDEAKRGQVHEALGFKSWTAYVADALGGQIQLSGESRQAMVQVLAGEGMSVRAIAAATGVSKSTVSNDLAAQVSNHRTPESDSADSGVQPLDTSSEPPAAITGMDGKTYTKPKRKPRPTPEPEPETVERKVQIPTAYRDTLKELKPLVAALTELTRDPRWLKSRERFNHKDRVTLDAHIMALKNFRAMMGELYNVTPVGESA